MAILVHPIVYSSLRSIGSKRTMLRSDNADLSTIALGSSHGDYGFNPKFFPGSFNLCCPSQDLNHSFLLYKHISEEYKHIKNVVLYYSVFSPGWNLAKNANEKYISVALNELFDLNFDYKDQELQAEFSKVKGRLKALNFESPGYRGFMPDGEKMYFSEAYGAQRRANDHMKWNKSKEENIHLLKLILLAKHLNHNLFIVIPPARLDYRHAMNQGFENLFESLFEILFDFKLNFNVKLMNFYESELFDSSHFGDFDHLSSSGKGPEILTKMIFEYFEKDENPSPSTPEVSAS